MENISSPSGNQKLAKVQDSKILPISCNINLPQENNRNNINDNALFEYEDRIIARANERQSPIPQSSYTITKPIPELLDGQDSKELISRTFDLHDVIQRYGNHPELLELILSSKLEEDRRRAEEARLKQKELEYMILSKKEAQDPYYRYEKEQYTHYPLSDTALSERAAAEKGKARQSISSNMSYFCTSTSPHQNTTMVYNTPNNENEQMSKLDIKRKRDQMFGNTMGELSPSYLFAPEPDSSLGRIKRHNSFNQIPSFNRSSTDDKSETGNITRKIQTLDFLDSRRGSSSNYASFSRSSGEDNNKSISNLNTLPPISVSLQSHGRQNSSNSMSMSTSLPTHASLYSDSNTNSQPKKIKSFSTLDSFEASIMETLPFYDKMNESISTPEMHRRSSIQLDQLLASSRISTPSGSRQQQRSTSLDEANSSQDTSSYRRLNIPTRDASGGSELPKKLIMPLGRSPTRSSSESSTKVRRRKREMQPISMIIETREFPYNDEYAWKNNGNTVHKTTGQKSIYYKCANSIAGCSVNKTVTFKENGEYLIKYRGHHLSDCNKIKRIVNV